MYAIVATGGKEYAIEVGATIQVEKLDVELGAEVILDRVLLVADNDDIKIGAPFVDGAQVVAEVVRQARGPKIIVFKRKPKKGYKKKQGHRQSLTGLRIKKIVA